MSVQPLRSVELKRTGDAFPFDLPVFERFERLEFQVPVTFLVGENGCGKSTLLEIVAAGLKLVSLGQAAIEQHPLMQTARDAVQAFRFVRSATIRHGFFFRADDVTGYLQSVQRTTRDHEQIAAELAESITAGWGRDRAVGG